jgi:hypothetical protein
LGTQWAVDDKESVTGKDANEMKCTWRGGRVGPGPGKLVGLSGGRIPLSPQRQMARNGWGGDENVEKPCSRMMRMWKAFIFSKVEERSLSCA